MKIERFLSLPSTSDYLKKLKDPPEDVVAIADEQTGGRGSKGRSFSSEKGGCYLSVLKLFPCKAKDAFSIMESAALAVVDTLSAFGVKSGIKWPNDVYADGKKICGILIENTFSEEDVSRSVIGIGVNVNNDLPPELSPLATSVKLLLGKEIALDPFVATLVYNVYREYTHEEYVGKSLVPGKKIIVVRPDGHSYEAVADRVLPDGRLKLVSGEILSAAEVSVRL